MAWYVLLCLPLHQSTVLAVCPFCKDREKWKERYWVSAASFSVSLLDFLAHLKFVMHLAWFYSASKTAFSRVQQKVHQQNRELFFQDMRQVELVLFF